MLTSRALATALRNGGVPVFRGIDDSFTSNLAAGAVNNTLAEPGPGVRSVIDASSRLSLSGGSAVFSTAAANDPRMAYDPLVVVPGRISILELTPADISQVLGMGHTSSATNVPNTFQFNTSGVISGLLSGSVALATYSAGVQYKAALLNRGPGYFWFLWDSVSAKWKMLGFSLNFASAGQLLTPAFGARGASTMNAQRFVMPPNTLWLPAPLISDGFSAWGTSDGFGHVEGVAGGLGSGGNGLAYTVTGTWGASGGVASASALVAGSAIAYVETGKADALVKIAFTRAGGDGGLLLRFADSNNFMSCRHDGTNIALIKKVAGANTTVRTTVTTYVAGAELMAIMQGSAVRIYYNNALVGAEDTIADAALVAATKHGLYTTNVSNTFDNFVAYARGSGGEFSALDAF